MRKKKKSKIWILMLILLIIVSVYVFYTKNKSEESESEVITKENQVIKTDIVNTVSKSSYIETALEENKELHATYYFQEIYFEENQYIKQGENILKYTNGTYMVAPYNCVITKIEIPKEQEMCTNKHYITIQSTDTFKILLNIDEDELDTVYVGQEAIIEIETLPDTKITGYVTNIANTATYSQSSSTFAIEVEFQNNGDILLGMSVKCSVVLEKAEGVIAVASEAITNKNNKKYVTVKLSDGTAKQVEVETGISNDAYTEVKKGLNEGDIALIEESTRKNTQENNRQNGREQKNMIYSNKKERR